MQNTTQRPPRTGGGGGGLGEEEGLRGGGIRCLVFVPLSEYHGLASSAGSVAASGCHWVPRDFANFDLFSKTFIYNFFFLLTLSSNIGLTHAVRESYL